MNQKKERHLFLGGNTSRGFFSHYSYLLPQETANRIICLKGGPGTGKSSLMKRVAKHFEEKSYEIEYYHCSSDADSLDGIWIKGLNIAMVDGTSPHVIDPIHPGAVDETVNLGIALNNELLTKNKKEIMEVQKKISTNFKRAYHFLGAAKEIHVDWSKLNTSSIDMNKLNILLKDLLSKVFTDSLEGYGKERHLFTTAFTPSGIVSHAEDIYKYYDNKFVISGDPGFKKTYILKEIGSEAQRRGYFVEYMHDPLIPERIEHLFIPEISTCILTENEISQNFFEGNKYYASDYADKSKLDALKTDLEYDADLFYVLTSKALDFILRAHELHDNLEAFYIKAMDYEVIDKIYNELIAKFESFENVE